MIGESDTYLVQKQGINWTCDCKWGRYRGHLRDCSHVVAAKQARKDPLGQATVARLADWLMEADGSMTREQARTYVYGMPYGDYKDAHQTPASEAQLAAMKESVAKNADAG